MAFSSLCPTQNTLSLSTHQDRIHTKIPLSRDFSVRFPFSSSPSSSFPTRCRLQVKFTRLRVKATAAPLMDQSTSHKVPTIVEVDLGNRGYPIYIGSGLLDQPDLLQRHVHGKKVLVVTNTTVAPLHLDKTVSALTDGNPNITVESAILPDREKEIQRHGHSDESL